MPLSTLSLFPYRQANLIIYTRSICDRNVFSFSSNEQSRSFAALLDAADSFLFFPWRLFVRTSSSRTVFCFPAEIESFLVSSEAYVPENQITSLLKNFLSRQHAVIRCLHSFVGWSGHCRPCLAPIYRWPRALGGSGNASIHQRQPCRRQRHKMHQLQSVRRQPHWLGPLPTNSIIPHRTIETDTSYSNIAFHDENVAQLGICGGIAGKITKCGGAPASTVGQSGTAKFTVNTATSGGTINVSKGRWEQCIRAARAVCPTGSMSATCAGGASNGDIKFTLDNP